MISPAFFFSSLKAIKKIALIKPAIIYSVLNRLSFLRKKDTFVFEIAALFFRSGQYYHLHLGSLDEYIQQFLTKCGITVAPSKHTFIVNTSFKKRKLTIENHTINVLPYDAFLKML